MIVRTLLTFMKQLHYNPKDVNDKFSTTLYDYYLDRVDGARRFLTQEQIDQLTTYRTQLDDEAKEGTFEFFDQSLSLLDAGIDKAKIYYQEILEEPFEFSTEEYYELDSDKRPYAENDAELKEYWRKSLKYDVLSRVARRLEDEQTRGEEEEPKSVEILEEEARAEVKENYDKYFKRIEKLKRSDRMSGYLNAMTQIFDPHSGYYKPIDKENFDIRMSGEYEGIGARLMLDGDYTKVSEVMAGGPAWRSKEIQNNDVFLKIAQGDDGEWQDIVGWVLDDVVQLIRGEKGTRVRLMLRTTEGTTKEVVLVRDKIKTEETFAKSLILDGPEEGERIGYIYLPSFYANFQDRDGRSCAKDVAKEIEKLKAENVDGIVMDLRNNGGGSLSDVIRMTGFFIEKGPIVQVKSRVRPAEVYRDVDANVQYDGPLAVMTNNFSASASEILAAALQDYDRAVIVGSESTFGKGTVQRFYDMDRVVRGNDDIKPLGNVKLTTQKFYRIDGGSTQLRGVTPDIILPDSYQKIETGEEQEDYPLSWTEIEAVDYSQTTYVINDKHINKLKKASEKRVAQNSAFQLINENAARISKNRSETLFPLQLEAYQALTAKREAEAKKFEDLSADEAMISASNLKADYDYVNQNEKNKALNEDFVKNVSRDHYIEETLHILHDLIDLKQN
ncbi:MAG TPA: carboxy terminal-processing peptidase [Saprospiraceae bacterium]|nr:carboxy terminal-processing peptidase [Saprospiraceae bacterium]